MGDGTRGNHFTVQGWGGGALSPPPGVYLGGGMGVPSPPTGVYSGGGMGGGALSPPTGANSGVGCGHPFSSFRGELRGWGEGGPFPSSREEKKRGKREKKFNSNYCD